MMPSQNRQRFAILLVLAGFALRAVAPLGYMPSALGSGYLFELCPDQMPVGFTFAETGSHHHHHDSSDTEAPATTADLCDFGHLLISVVADDLPAIELAPDSLAVAFIPETGRTPDLVAFQAYLSRAPPA